MLCAYVDSMFKLCFMRGSLSHCQEFPSWASQYTLVLGFLASMISQMIPLVGSVVAGDPGGGIHPPPLLQEPSLALKDC